VLRRPPHQRLHAPLAVPGNHDGTPIDDATPSLAAFLVNFCTLEPHISTDARGARRLTMTQPNPYFTLTTPFVTIIGLYDNVLMPTSRLDQLRTAGEQTGRLTGR
jgi:hypothetical protein